MRRNSFWTYRNCGRVVAATAIIALIACVDWSRTTAPVKSSAASDYVVTGILFNAIWSPTAAGPEFRGSAAMPVDVSVKHGVVNVKQREAVSVTPDIEAAQRLRHDLSSSALLPAGGTRLSKPAGTAPGLTKLAVKARHVSQRTIDGKIVRVASVPDPDRRSGRPPRASLIFVDGRLAVVMETQYARVSGDWRPVRTRTTAFDRTGKMALISETDASGLKYRSGVTQVGRAPGFRDRAGRPLASLIRLAQPDALYAATTQSLDKCMSELHALALAGFALWRADEAVEGARLGVEAARQTLETAEAKCVPDPTQACLDAVEAARLALVRAENTLEQAVIALYAAVYAYSWADYQLFKCLTKPEPQTTTGPKPGEGDGGECEEWCQWTITFDGDGNVISETLDYCWCEYNDAKQ